MDRIAKHVAMLTHWLAGKLHALKHSNGVHLVKIYGNHFTDEKNQGAIITFNLIKKDQTYYLFDEINAFFDKKHIHVRTGCLLFFPFCFPSLFAVFIANWKKKKRTFSFSTIEFNPSFTLSA